MNKAQFEFMNQYEARKTFTRLFNNGVFKNGFREATSGPTSGKVVGSKLFIKSTKYSSQELEEIVGKQKEF